MALGIALGIGAAIGGIGSFLGAQESNSQIRAATKRQNQYNEDMYVFQYGDIDSDELGGEALRGYEFAVEGLEITKANNEANLQYQEHLLVQDYNFKMGIRAYEFAQANRAYDQSVSDALQQQSFNQLAEQAAYTDRDWETEG